MNDNKFRNFPDWPLRHKLAHYTGIICGSIIGMALLIAMWMITLWRKAKGLLEL